MLITNKNITINKCSLPVHFLNKEVIIYPEDDNKPPVGAGLNRRAVVTLERVWPRDKTEKRPVTEPDR